MSRARKRNILFILIISVTISALLGLSSILNIVSFRNTYVDVTASSSAIVASGTVNKIEYTLKYGKSLDNYYGIEALFEELQSLYGYLNQVYIADETGNVIYQSAFTGAAAEPEQLGDMAVLALESGENQIWLEDNVQQMLLPIRDCAGETIASLGISYDIDMLDSLIEAYVDDAVLYTTAAIAVGICLLVLLFFTIKHGFSYKPLLMIVITVVVAANVFFGVAAYNVFSNGYIALTHHTSDIFYQKIRSDVEGVITKGVAYDELEGVSQYFEDTVAHSEELKSITLVYENANAGDSDFVNYYPLTADYHGNTSALRIEVSQQYVEGKIITILIEIAVSSLLRS